MINRTKKLNLTIPEDVFLELKQQQALYDIDNIVTDLLIKHYKMEFD